MRGFINSIKMALLDSCPAGLHSNRLTKRPCVDCLATYLSYYLFFNPAVEFRLVRDGADRFDGPKKKDGHKVLWCRPGRFIFNGPSIWMKRKQTLGKKYPIA